MQKPDKLYSYADFQDDLRNAVKNGQDQNGYHAVNTGFDQNGFKEAALNTQNLVPFFKIDPKTHKNIMRLMAGPGGAEINGNRMHGGDLTGQYVVDGPAADTISYSYNFHKFTPKQMHEMDPYNSIGLTQGITTYV